MKQNIEEAKRRVFFYYHDFINKCLEDHGIDLTTIINDCVTTGYESRSGEIMELREKLDQTIEYMKLYEEAQEKLYKAGIEIRPIRENEHSLNS